MGLVRLRKSVRIVNHPPHPAGDDRARPADPDEAAQVRRKTPKAANCFTYS